MTPFELVLSRPPPTLNIELSAPPAEKLSHREHKIRWLKQLQHLVETTKVNSAKSRARYKRGLDARLRKIRHLPKENGFIFLRRDYAPDDAGAKSKLAPTADGPFILRRLLDNHAIIQRGDALERVSLDRIVPSPTPAQAQIASLGKETFIVNLPEGADGKDAMQSEKTIQLTTREMKNKAKTLMRRGNAIQSREIKNLLKRRNLTTKRKKKKQEQKELNDERALTGVASHRQETGDAPRYGTASRGGKD